MKTHIKYFLCLGLIACGLLLGSLAPARAIGVFLNVGIAPPPLPVCVQPACPGLGYIWTPGYWAWDPTMDNYYWVPGTWVLAPEIGFLWTPPWWGWSNGAYCFNPGYWGPQVGFYGGINYGFGYYGHGYDGGHWHHDHFYYNRAVNNVGDLAASRTYSRAVAAGTSRVSYNGGAGGITARPTASELAAGRERHLDPTSAQAAQVRAASADPSLRYSANHGHPAITGTARAGELRPVSASAATGASHRTTAESAYTGESRRTTARATTGVSHRTTAESAYTGESRGTTERAISGESHRTAESAFTGESRSPRVASEEARSESRLASERVARANEEHRSAAEAESRRASVETHSFSSYRPTESRPHYSEARSFAMPSHASAFHASAFHAPAFHGFSGGGGFHAASHAGGGFHGAPRGGPAQNGRR